MNGHFPGSCCEPCGTAKPELLTSTALFPTCAFLSPSCQRGQRGRFCHVLAALNGANGGQDLFSPFPLLFGDLWIQTFEILLCSLAAWPGHHE